MSLYSSDNLSGRTIPKFHKTDNNCKCCSNDSDRDSSVIQNLPKNCQSAHNLASSRSTIRYSSQHDFRRKNFHQIHPSVRPNTQNINYHSLRVPRPRSRSRSRSRKEARERNYRSSSNYQLDSYYSQYSFVDHHNHNRVPPMGLVQPFVIDNNNHINMIDDHICVENQCTHLPNLVKELSQSESSVLSISIAGCGGHCLIFQNFCHYFLQVIFLMGILTGIALCLVGSVLKQTGSRDLQVLVYIGALTSMVCTLLLTVQCRVRNQVRTRKKNVYNANNNGMIPLNPLRSPSEPTFSDDNGSEPDYDENNIV